MADTAREARVLAAVVSLVDNLLEDFDVVELLTDLTERCAALLDVEAAGLLLADPRRHLHLMAATSPQSLIPAVIRVPCPVSGRMQPLRGVSGGS